MYLLNAILIRIIKYCNCGARIIPKLEAPDNKASRLDISATTDDCIIINVGIVDSEVMTELMR